VTHPQRLRPRGVPSGLAALLVLSLLAGCEDDPFGFQDWESRPDTVFLYSLDRPELNLPSGYNFNRRTLHEVESANSTGQWDVAVGTGAGGLVLIPPRALGVDAGAGIAPLPDETFDAVREAPGDTSAYVTTEPVPVEVGRLYVIRTNQGIGQFGRRCTWYAKMEPLEADPVLGILRFRLDSNPLCNDRDLIPPED
jgi:hypothetical protein